MVKERVIVTSLLCMLPCLAQAGGWSAWATPERIDVVRSEGLMVYGKFGNPANCTIGDRFFIKRDHSQYKEILSVILSAKMSDKQIQVYSHQCESVGWFSGPDTTFNVVIPASAVNIK